ncbi:hypothetical protein TRVL_10237 [Trypanosoma vivax]|nr:hypothetical protein TRVL_10237 [Trypanosoma vivax]
MECRGNIRLPPFITAVMGCLWLSAHHFSPFVTRQSHMKLLFCSAGRTASPITNLVSYKPHISVHRYATTKKQLFPKTHPTKTVCHWPSSSSTLLVYVSNRSHFLSFAHHLVFRSNRKTLSHCRAQNNITFVTCCHANTTVRTQICHSQLLKSSFLAELSETLHRAFCKNRQLFLCSCAKRVAATPQKCKEKRDLDCCPAISNVFLKTIPQHVARAFTFTTSHCRRSGHGLIGTPQASRGKNSWHG